MPRRWPKSSVRLLGLGAALALAAAAVVLWPRVREEWHLSRLDHPDPQARLLSIQELGRLRSARSAAPLARLVAVERRESLGRHERDTAALAGGVRAFVRVQPRDSEAAAAAVEALSSIGPAGEHALDAFAEAASISIGDVHADGKTLAALSWSRPELVFSLLDASTPRLRWAAAVAVGELGEQGLPAVPRLVALAPSLHGYARGAIGKIGRAAIPVVMETLAEMIERYGDVVLETHEFRLGADIVADVPDVRDILGRWLAVAATPAGDGRDGGDGRPARDGIAAASRRRLVGLRIARVLGDADDDAALVPGLVAALSDESPDVRRNAAQLLRWQPESADRFAADLASILGESEESEHVRLAAAYTLTSLREAAAPAVPELIACLDGEPWCRERAIALLSAIGPDAAAARPALERWAIEGDEATREAAQRALAAVGE